MLFVYVWQTGESSFIQISSRILVKVFEIFENYSKNMLGNTVNKQIEILDVNKIPEKCFNLCTSKDFIDDLMIIISHITKRFSLVNLLSMRHWCLLKCE